MMRISMSLPKKLLAEFDEVLKDRGYQSRSKGIRDALSDYILRYQWMNEMEGQRVGVITIIYDHHFTGVMESLADIQHDYRQEINASMHIHMTHKYCMEVIVVATVPGEDYKVIFPDGREERFITDTPPIGVEQVTFGELPDDWQRYIMALYYMNE